MEVQSPKKKMLQTFVLVIFYLLTHWSKCNPNVQTNICKILFNIICATEQIAKQAPYLAVLYAKHRHIGQGS